MASKILSAARRTDLIEVEELSPLQYRVCVDTMRPRFCAEDVIVCDDQLDPEPGTLVIVHFDTDDEHHAVIRRFAGKDSAFVRLRCACGLHEPQEIELKRVSSIRVIKELHRPVVHGVPIEEPIEHTQGDTSGGEAQSPTSRRRGYDYHDGALIPSS
jgi:hypothetical protein